MFMNVKHFLLMAAMLSTSVAQTYDIRGKITRLDGQPLEGATVKLMKAGYSALSDHDGNFFITDTRIRHNPIRSSHPGLLSVTVCNGSLFVMSGQKAVMDIVKLNLQGGIVGKTRLTVEPGKHILPFMEVGAGVFLYRITLGATTIFLKTASMRSGDGELFATVSNAPSTTSSIHMKQAAVTKMIYDILTVTKEGYIDYREMIEESVTDSVDIALFQSAGTLTDADGNTYQTIKIGEQIWTAENFRTTSFNDGTPISHDTANASWYGTRTGKYCFYNNTTDADSMKLFGALYNWYAVSEAMIAPRGWHVPTERDWNDLESFLMANGYGWDGATTEGKITKALAAKTTWYPSYNEGAPGNDLLKNNASGFSALPGGLRFSDGTFIGMTDVGYWWAADQYENSTAYARYIMHNAVSIGRGSKDMVFGYSLRLLKN